VESISIGLDIGSSAVRAAEIEVRPGRRVLRRYAQVGLPSGFVVDGEVVNQLGVADALRRLWAEGGFSSNRVVLGVSGPRVFVRQAEVPAMSREDMRSSLRFNAQEMVPISLDEASFDFSVLEESGPEGGSDARARVLLVAAHQDVLRTYLAVLKMAGLSAVAMDSSALALVRAVPTASPADEAAGLEVLVSVGAELTTVAVRQNGVPSFIRSLTVGGAKLTTSVADQMHLEVAVAERLKRGAVPADTPQIGQVRRALSRDVRDLAEDVRATVDFFTGQADGGVLDKLLITGGASQTAGLADAIGGDLPVKVYKVAPFTGFSVEPCGLSEDDLDRASATATTAIGLALWPFESPFIRLSILPDEVFRIQRNRRLMQAGAVGILAIVGLLGAVGAGRYLQVKSAQKAEHSAQRQVTLLTGQVTVLQAKTAIHETMIARATMDVSALKGDLDYVRIMGQLATVMPPNLHITSASINRQAAAGGGAGTITMSVTGTGDPTAAAEWLRSLQRDPDLSGSWIGGVSVTTTGGTKTVSFGSNATLTNTADSNRSEAAQP
jgi:type IV pilus assembly protein PilM